MSKVDAAKTIDDGPLAATSEDVRLGDLGYEPGAQFVFIYAGNANSM